MVSDLISSAFVGVVEAADVRCAAANTTLNCAHAESRVSVRLAPADCGFAKWLDSAADKADPKLQSLFTIPQFPNLAEEVVSGAREDLPSHLSLIPWLLTNRGAGYIPRCAR